MFSRLPLRRISFRWQITLLCAVVLFLLAAVLTGSLSAFRYSRSSVLREEQKSLRDATDRLAREYTEKGEFAKRNNEVPPLANPNSAFSQEVLSLLSRVALQNDPGVVGGFYSTSQNDVQGYWPGWSNDSSQGLAQSGLENERQAIQQLARQAAISQQPASQVLSSDQDIVLLDATPLPAEFGYSSSAWAMKKMPDLPGSNRFRAYVNFTALGIAAFACVLLTLLLVRNLQVGVQKLEAGLRGLEANLNSQIQASDEPDEIKRIASAINRLGTTLQQKIESESLIENRLRHAERLAALGRLVAGVAHEVRNPLATIRLRVQMCQQASVDPLIQESCSVAIEEIERLNDMVSRLLSFSRPVRLQREPTNLTRLLEQRLKLFRDKAIQEKVRVSANFPSRSRLVNVDQSRMTQVFDNLIQNAIEAMSETGGNLCVNFSDDGRQNTPDSAVYIEFNDTGKGIDPDELSRIFDPFFTTKPAGTGLGLSICHELVQAHGGEIQVASAKGNGTTVRIVLPSRYEHLSETLA